MSKDEKALVTGNQQYAVSKEFASQFDQSLQSSGDNMDAKDFRIPKLTLVQALTKADFNTQNAPVGHYINSIEGTDMGNKLDMFVMTDVKLWQFYYEQKKGKDKVEKVYLGTVPQDASNSDLRKNFRLPPELKEKFDDLELKPDQLLLPDEVIRYFVLLVDEVKEGVAFPYIIDFKRSSYPAGNALKNICFKMRKLSNVPSYAKVFTLSSEFVQNDHDYYVKKVNGGRPVEADEIKAIEDWIRELSNNKAKYAADETEEKTTGYDDGIVDAEVVNDAQTEGGPKF